MNTRTTVNTNTSPVLPPRGLRIESAAAYSALSPFYLEECVRNGTLPAIGGPGSGVCAAYIITREHLDKFMDDLAKAAVERAKQRRSRKAQSD